MKPVVLLMQGCGGPSLRILSSSALSLWCDGCAAALLWLMCAPVQAEEGEHPAAMAGLALDLKDRLRFS